MDTTGQFIFSGPITRPLDLAAVCGGRTRLEVDVGSGMGRFILARAAAHPDTQFIGIERLKSRVRKIARKASRAGLDNIFMVRLEATYILRYLIPPASVSRFYLFFPDPWPKRRHSGHRVFNDEFRYLVWTRLAPGGDLQVATDSGDYFADMVAQMAGDPFFRRIPPVERTEDERTDFELIFRAKGLIPNEAGFQAVGADELGAGAVARLHAADAARRERFWAEEMPHAKSAHVVGIGGTGMSAIAQALIDSGYEVTGSDRLADHGESTPLLDALRRQGVRIFPQDGSGVSDATSFVAVSTAIEDDNPDIAEARRLGAEIVHRSVALERLARGRTQIAVAGTSGKSTTTAILGWILETAGLDPTVVNGAPIVGWDDGGARVGSVRRGDGPLFVFEADESDRSFLRFSPDYAIVTNETPDHFTREETLALFADFKSQVKGEVVEGLPPDFEAMPGATPWKSRFRSRGSVWSLALPGRHNCMNACQAADLALALGVPENAIRKALLTFPGVGRRLQRVGNAPGGALVVDDYAHNPEKLAAAITTLSARTTPLAVLWRPHGYAPLRKMLAPLADAFAGNLRREDSLFLLPVYDAGGTADRSISSEDLEREIRARGFGNVAIVDDAPAAVAALRRFASSAPPTAGILVCGARDPGLPGMAMAVAAQ
ncbi:MAG: tRNA (guanosine(46)-N7)-methyltransferase TrmB [Kiritimatiellae bacterium]|nr:tRNA (guanosine(46)-N7)-methyltransferase TrmB [Kiritimatiellia bacterium]